MLSMQANRRAFDEQAFLFAVCPESSKRASCGQLPNDWKTGNFWSMILTGYQRGSWSLNQLA